MRRAHADPDGALAHFEHAGAVRRNGVQDRVLPASGLDDAVAFNGGERSVRLVFEAAYLTGLIAVADPALAPTSPAS